MGAPISYYNLSYDQFIAGKLYWIMNVSSNAERQGCVTLLQKIANWKLMIGASWNQIRNTYAHILRKIENREITWSADFNQFEKHIYEKVALK